MSTATQHTIRCLFFSSATIFSSLATAAGGIIHFVGAIVEPGCSVQTQTVALATLSTSKSGAAIPLNVYCNTNKNVQISLSDSGASVDDKNFSTGVSGANITVSYKTQLVAPGDKINYRFDGKKEIQVPLTAMLRKAASLAPDTMHSNVLISFEYR